MTQIEYYVVPGVLTKKQQEKVIAVMRAVTLGMEVTRFLQAAILINRSLQPRADVQLAAKIQTPSTVSPTHIIAVNRSLFPVGETVEVVRRADMEARVAHLVAEIARLRVVEGEMHLLEEVCAFYANDEDRFINADGNAEPYGMIPTDVGMKARSARARFMAREKAAQAAGGEA